WVADAEPGADRRAERHHGRSSDIGELAADHRILGAIGQHHEPLRNQRLGGPNELRGIGIEQLAIADHLDLQPVRLQSHARELGGEDRILSGLAARGVGQEMDVLGDQVDEALVVTSKADAADRGSRHLAAARLERLEHHLAVGITRGAEKQARSKLAAGNHKRIGHMLLLHPPWRARTISTLSPPCSGASFQAARGTTAPLSATAMPRCAVSTAFSSNSAASVATLRISSWPLMRMWASVMTNPIWQSYSAARTGAKRSIPNGRIAGATVPSSTRRAIASAVTGASRMPLPWWPVA